MGRVQNDGSEEGNGLIPLTLPQDDSAGALLIPTTGPSLRFSLSAIKTGSVATLRTFIAKARKWVTDGGNLGTNNIIYNSELDGSDFSVRAVRFNKNWIAADPRILNYTLELVQGTAVGVSS